MAVRAAAANARPLGVVWCATNAHDGNFLIWANSNILGWSTRGATLGVVFVAVERVRPSSRSVLKGRIASAICAVPALYCLGILSFALYNGHQYASAGPQLCRYILVPGALFAAFASVAAHASRRTRLTVGLTGIAVILALFAFELKLQAAAFSAVSELVSVPAAAALDSADVSHGLPPAGTPKKLTRLLGITTLADSVVGGMPGARTLLCGGRGQPVIYRADRYGFRNADTVYDRAVQTMFLGDSFVEGICLPQGLDLVGQFRARNPATVGIGSRGAGPLLELAMLGRFGPAIRPRHVVMVFYEGNDWENLDHELRRAWLVPALRAGADFGPAVMPAATIERAQPILQQWFTQRPPGMMAVVRGAHIPRNLLALHQTWTQLGLGYPKAAPEFPEYARILARAKAIAATWDGEVRLAYVPQTSRLIGVFPHQFVFDQVRDKVRAAATANRIPLIDLTPVFLNTSRPIALYGADGHLSAAGASLAARTIDAALTTPGPRP